MDMVMKILMGGWIPENKRTQWMAFAVALGAILVALVNWGSGDLSLTNLMVVLKDQWAILVASYVTYFVAEKIDAVKELVAKNGKK